MYLLFSAIVKEFVNLRTKTWLDPRHVFLINIVK